MPGGVFDPQPSLSTVGRMTDPFVTGPPKKIHIPQHKVKLRPWDGIALVEAVVAEAQRATRETLAPREVVYSSSPRVNPTLLLRDVVETGEKKAHAFLNTIVRDVPEVATAPAIVAAATAAAAPPLHDDKGRVTPEAAAPITSIVSQPSRRRKHGHGSLLIQLRSQDAARTRSGTATPSRGTSSFLTAPVREREPKPNAPPVGQYLPKYQVVLRRAPQASLGTAPRSSSRGDNIDGDERVAASVSPVHTVPPAAAAVPTPATVVAAKGASQSPIAAPASPNLGLTDTKRSGVMAASFRSTLRPASYASGTFDLNDPQEDSRDRFHRQPPRGTSPFMNQIPRFSAARDGPTVPLPWPLMTPGTRPSTSGTFSKLRRPSAFGAESHSVTRGIPSRDGADASVRSRTPCLVLLQTQPSRESHRGFKLLMGPEPCRGPPLPVEHIAVERVLSTFSRPPTPLEFSKQQPRPPSPHAADGSTSLEPRPLEQPKGFVELRRMVYSSNRVITATETTAKTGPSYDPQYDAVLRRAPTPVFGRARRDTGLGLGSSSHSGPPPPSGGSPEPTARREAAVESWSSVRRHRPVAIMTGPGRNAPIMRMSRDTTPAADYDYKPPSPRAASPDLSRGLSREARDARYKVQGCIDVIYDVPPPKSPHGVLPFDKLTSQR